MIMLNKPFSRSYWVIPDQFLAGYYPGDQHMETMEEKMQGLLNCGIRCVINLIESDELDHEGQTFVDYVPVIKKLANDGAPVEFHRMPIRNLEIPSRDFMVQLLDCIDDALGKNLPVYIHCWGGQGRTGTVVGCWLIRHGITEGEGVLEKIKELRRFDSKAHNPSPMMPDQIQMVLSWEKGQ
jgi:protein-tyrosine phosphatase